MSAGVYWLFLLLLFILNVAMAASSSSRGLTRFPGLPPCPSPFPHQWQQWQGDGRGLCDGMFSGSWMSGWGRGFDGVGEGRRQP